MRLIPVTPAAIAACLLAASAAGAQEPSAYTRIQALGLDTLRMERVTTLYAGEDRARAAELTSLLRDASGYFERELGLVFPLRVAALPAGHWISDIPVAQYTIPYGIEAEHMVVVPASGARLPGRRTFTRAFDFIALHEYGHLANTRYFRSGRWKEYAPAWFEEFLATYWAYAFVRHAYPEWADPLLSDWPALLAESTPPELSLDWSFMRRLPPQKMGEVYGWYQIMLNLRVAQVYAEYGLGFLRTVRDTLPWETLDSWTTPALLKQLDQIAPGFQAWADRLRSGAIGAGGG